MRKPTWFDWLVYRLFLWRWNPIFRDNAAIRKRFREYWDWWEGIVGPAGNEKARGE